MLIKKKDLRRKNGKSNLKRLIVLLHSQASDLVECTHLSLGIKDGIGMKI